MRRWLWVVILFSWASVVMAQAELTETYIQRGEFAIDYPAEWLVETGTDTGFVSLSKGDLRLTLYSPAVLRDFGFENYNPSTLLQLLVALNDVTPGEVEMIEPDGARLAYRRDDDAGLLIAATFTDGTLGVVDVFGPAESLRENENLVLMMAATFDVPPVPAPEVLANYAESWPETIAELAESSLIPIGGEIVFAERYTFASGSNRIQPLAQAISITNVVMAGSLRLTPSANPQNDRCAMLAQVNGTDALEVGINDAGRLYLMIDSRILQDNVDTNQQHRVLLLTLDERLIVYLDGVLVADEEIAPVSGHFGIKAQGGVGTTCEATDLWVYRVSTAALGQCDILAAGGAVNKRTGPGTEFEIVGVLEADAAQPAIDRTTGSDGLIWWQLDDGGWVREDVVQAAGTCHSLPGG